MDEFIKRILLLNNKIAKAPHSTIGESVCLIFTNDEWHDLKDIMEFVLVCTEKAHKREFKKAKRSLEYD